MYQDILIIVYRTLLSYAVLLVLMKFMGKREIGQLSLVDLLVLLSISNILVLGIENFEDTILFSFVPMALLALIQKVIAYTALRVPIIRHIFDGKESLIIKKGKLQIKEMKKQGYNMDDLLIHLREKDIRSIEEVEYAVLETNGHLSVFKYSQDDRNVFPLPLVISGEVNKNSLKVLEKGEEWLRSELKKQQINDLKSIYCAFLQDGKIKIIPFEKQ